eukprot:5655500-Pleurochrysis_carterae.AAC.1
MVVKVHENTPRGIHERRSRATHGPAQEADGVGDVRSRLSGAVQERAYERLVRLTIGIVDGPLRFGA